MGDVISLPLKGTAFGLRALNQIARVGLAACWLKSMAYDDPLRSRSRGHARELDRRLTRLVEALRHLEGLAGQLASRLNEEDEAVYGTPQEVLFLRRTRNTLVIDNFIAAGLEHALARIDALAARTGGRRLGRRTFLMPSRAHLLHDRPLLSRQLTQGGLQPQCLQSFSQRVHRPLGRPTGQHHPPRHRNRPRATR